MTTQKKNISSPPPKSGPYEKRFISYLSDNILHYFNMKSHLYQTIHTLYILITIYNITDV